MKPANGKEFPKLDLIDQGYDYENPPASYPVSREYDSNDLQQNLLQPKGDEVKKRDPNLYPLLACSVLIAIDIAFFFYIMPEVSLFEFCYWNFGIENYNLDESYYMIKDYKGSIAQFYKDIECDTNPYQECPGLCQVAFDFKSGINWFYRGLVAKYAFSAIGYFAIGYATRKNYLKHLRLIFIINEAISFLALLIGIICFFNIVDLSRLGSPTVGTLGFEPKNLKYDDGMYLSGAAVIWILISRVVVAFFIKDAK